MVVSKMSSRSLLYEEVKLVAVVTASYEGGVSFARLRSSLRGQYCLNPTSRHQTSRGCSSHDEKNGDDENSRWNKPLLPAPLKGRSCDINLLTTVSPLNPSWHRRPSLIDTQLLGIILVRGIAQARRPARKTALFLQGGNIRNRSIGIIRADYGGAGRVYLLLDG